MKWRMRILLNICYVILINFVEMNTFFKVLARRHKVDTNYDHQWTIVRVKKQWRHAKSLLIIGQHFMSCWTCFLPEIIYQPFKHHHHHRHHHIYDNIFSQWLCCCKLSILGLTVIMQSRNCVLNGGTKSICNMQCARRVKIVIICCEHFQRKHLTDDQPPTPLYFNFCSPVKCLSRSNKKDSS